MALKNIVRNTVDGFMSALTGMGSVLRDKRLSVYHATCVKTSEELEDLWRGNDMAARIVETVPNEMLREGFVVQVASDANIKAQIEDLHAKIDELGVRDQLQTGLNYERALGGAGVFIGAVDGVTDLSLPLNEDTLQDIRFLNVFQPNELHPVAWYADPLSPKYGKPAIYQLQPQVMPIPETTISGPQKMTAPMVRVHESRFLILPGIQVSRRQQLEQRGWGDSVLTRCDEVLRDYSMAWAATALLLHDFSQAVLKIEGLAELVASNDDETLRKRAVAIDYGRSTCRAVLLDSKEDFERKATPVAGLPELLDKFAIRLSAAADMPTTLLMGQSPAGLNATGDSDVRFFYDRIKAKQHTHLLPHIKRLVTLLMKCKAGAFRGVEPENWSICFNPLWQLSDLEQADVRLKQAQIDHTYITDGVLMPEEVAISRFGGDEYSTETEVDLEGRAEMTKPPEPTDPPADSPPTDEPNAG